MRTPPSTDLLKVFPNLSRTKWEKRSEADGHYNCLAWAFGSDTAWWESIRYGGYYWPDGIERDDTAENWIRIAQMHGYELCSDAEFEAGFDKLAIFVDKFGDPGHIVRSHKDGGWLSKLGKLEDIWHETLEAVECAAYGKPTIFLKKPVSD